MVRFRHLQKVYPSFIYDFCPIDIMFMERIIFTNLTIDELREIIGSEVKKNITGLNFESKYDSDTIDINEAAKITGYTKSTIYTKVSRNQIPNFKQGGLRFDRKELIDWMRSSKNKTYRDIDRISNDYLIKKS